MIEAGEIYYVAPGESHATGCEIWPGRPGIVISSQAAVACSGTVNVIYLTSSRNPKPFSVPVPDTAFFAASKEYPAHVALCGQIHAVDKSRLGNFLGRIPDSTLKEIATALNAANLAGFPYHAAKNNAKRQKPRRNENA